MSKKLDKVLNELINNEIEEDEIIFRSTNLDDPANGVVVVFNNKNKIPLSFLFNNFNNMLSDVISTPEEEGKCIYIVTGTKSKKGMKIDKQIMMNTTELVTENSEYVQ